MSASFEELLKQVKMCPKKVLSVAVAQDTNVLEAVSEAQDKGIADPILVGDAEKIRDIAASTGVDVSDMQIINVIGEEEAAKQAVRLVHDGDADMYMKGALPTKMFLRSVLDKEVGLRTGSTLSHVAVFEIPIISRLLFLTDVAFLPYPTLEQKEQIINYTVQVARACGVQRPKVAPLAAVEVVNEKMPATVEAAQLTQWNLEGRIRDCIVDGPLSMDLAIDPTAAEHKEGAAQRRIVGDADILLFPDIHAGNLVYKIFVRYPNGKNGGILMGTKAPVVLTSRSDTKESKVNSIALAAIVAEHLKKQQTKV
ncbi:MAG: phosphate butyryltransferase [Lachnospiraceae bacterium]|jgi:phosphate butyryltransferase|nr:phosphate butyryltransferase [Lachnospiraceae bacterium]